MQMLKLFHSLLEPVLIFSSKKAFNSPSVLGRLTTPLPHPSMNKLPSTMLPI